MEPGSPDIARAYGTRLPVVTARPTGIAEIVWYDARDFPSYGHYELYHSRLAWSGGDVLPPGGGSIDQAKLTTVAAGFYEAETPGSNFSGWSFPPGASLGADGLAHVGWIDGKSDIWYTRLDASGLATVPATRLVDYPSVQRRHAADGGDRRADRPRRGRRVPVPTTAAPCASRI